MNIDGKGLLFFQQLRKIDSNLPLSMEQAEAVLKDKRVYVASPLRDETPELIRRNMLAARNVCKWLAPYCKKAWAPHAWLPEFLDDNDPTERAVAIRFGSELLIRSDLVVTFGEKISVGMAAEIAEANKKGIPVYCLEYKN